jgi:hypothetical protein
VPHEPLVESAVESDRDVQSGSVPAPGAPGLLRQRRRARRQAQVQGDVEREVDAQLERVGRRDAEDAAAGQGLLDSAAGARVVARSVCSDAGGERGEEALRRLRRRR